MQQTKLQDLGYSLPCGLAAPDGSRKRNFSFRPWRGSDERKVSKVRAENPAISPSAFATHVLAYFLKSWCGHDFDRMSMPERELLLSGAYAGDFYDAWFQLRRDVIDDELRLRLTCPLCRYQFVYGVKLGTTDVWVAEDGEDLKRQLRLKHGFRWREKDSKWVQLAPVRWRALEGMSGVGLDTGAIKAEVILGSIVGLDGHEGPVLATPDLFDELTKADIELLKDAVDEIHLGPSLSIEVDCPKQGCGNSIKRWISWVYDDFFSAQGSSLGAILGSSTEKSQYCATTSPDSATTLTAPPPDSVTLLSASSETRSEKRLKP